MTPLPATTAERLDDSAGTIGYASVMAEFRLRNVPENLKRRLKKMAIDTDETVNALLIRLIQEAVDRHEEGRS